MFSIEPHAPSSFGITRVGTTKAKFCAYLATKRERITFALVQYKNIDFIGPHPVILWCIKLNVAYGIDAIPYFESYHSI
jgi:hypothetical protein